jgi:hypothetical protein
MAIVTLWHLRKHNHCLHLIWLQLSKAKVKVRRTIPRQFIGTNFHGLASSNYNFVLLIQPKASKMQLAHHFPIVARIYISKTLRERKGVQNNLTKRRRIAVNLLFVDTNR